jgi:hypothetical protein
VEKLAAYVVREGALSAFHAVGWIVRLAATLEPIHGLGVAHGRVSTKAVQIQSPDCRSEGYLLDASSLPDDPAFFSPERLAGAGRSTDDDAWAAGVTLHWMLTGTLPFPGTTVTEVADRIRAGSPSPLAVYDVGDDDLQLVLDELFAREPGQRLMSLGRLREMLIAWNPALAKVPPLKYGRPEEAGAHGDDDGEMATTAVITPSLDVKAVVAQYKAQRAAQQTAVGGARPSPRGEVPDIHTEDSVDILLDAETGLSLVDEDGVRASQPASDPGPRPSPPPAAVSLGLAREEPTPPALELHPSRRPPAMQRSMIDEPTGDLLPRRRLAPATYLFGVVCVIVGAAAGVLLLGRPPADGQAPPAAMPAPAPPTATATAGPTASAVAPAKTQPPAEPDAVLQCVEPLFPEGTFGERSGTFAFVCDETSPIKGALAFRTLVVTSGGGTKGTTAAMREWNELGWYGPAVFALVRARCCAAPKPLTTPPTAGACQMDPSLGRLAQAALGSDDAELERAVQGYGHAVMCAARSGASSVFGREGPPQPGEEAAFRLTLDRARKLRR